MIDVYAPTGVFDDKHQLARDLAAAVMQVEQVPDIAMFRENTAAFVHELPSEAITNVDGGSGYVRVQVMTNAGALDRDKQVAPAPTRARIGKIIWAKLNCPDLGLRIVAGAGIRLPPSGQDGL